MRNGLGEKSGVPRQSFTQLLTTQSTSGTSCGRWGPVLLEDGVSTAERFRERIVVRAQHALEARSFNLRLRQYEVRREHGANTVRANAQASCDHDRGALQCVQKHRGEDVSMER